MAQVPYVPYPTAQPISPGERISVQTPGAAFGENIGAALRQLGTTGEQVGGEIFQRAVALQDLRNETEAREADSKYAEQQGLLHADYTSKEGKAAVDGLKPYIQSSHDLRQSVRDSLSNPEAQRMFDAASLGFLQRNIFNAAGHAGSENKRYVVGTATASMDLASRTMVNPEDEREANAKIESMDRESHTVANAQNWEEVQRQDLLLKKTSQFREGQITTVGHTNVGKAFDLLEKHKDQMSQDAYDRTKDRLLLQNRAQGSSFVADKVYKPGMSLGEAEDKAKELAPKYAHDDPLFADAAVRAVRGKFSIADQAKRQQDHDNIVKVDQAIQTSGAKDLQELMANPETAAAIEALPADKRKSIPQAINSYNAAKFKNANDTNFSHLWGMANGDASDREKFMNQDLTTYQLSQGQIDRLITKKANILKNPDTEDPRLHRAVGWLADGKTGAWMNAIGLNKKQDPDNWYKFTGALEQAIDVWTQENKKPPSYKELKETIGPQILKQQYHVPGVFGIYGGPFGSDKAVFEREVPEDFINSVKQRAIGKNEPIPDDKEIFQAYMRQEFIKLYKKSGDGGPAQPKP